LLPVDTYYFLLSSLKIDNIINYIKQKKEEILKPEENKTNIRIPLKREEVEVSRTPYVKEEIVVKKKPVTETRTVSEEIITEKVEEPQV
jgi:stress response protein YsnF